MAKFLFDNIKFKYEIQQVKIFKLILTTILCIIVDTESSRAVLAELSNS